MKRNALFAVLLMLLIWGVPAHADIQTARDLMDAGKYEDAIRELEPIAEQGDAEAQYLLGEVYLYEPGGVRNDEVMAKWIKRAAEQDHPDALVVLYQLYGAGRGVEKDLTQALKYLKKAADMGVHGAQLDYGLSLAYGDHGKKDLKEGTDWIQRAANRNLDRAQYWLGVNSLKLGNGIYFRLMAYKWLKLSVDKRFPRPTVTPQDEKKRIVDAVATLTSRLEQALDSDTLEQGQKFVDEWTPAATTAEIEKRLEADAFCLGRC